MSDLIFILLISASRSFAPPEVYSHAVLLFIAIYCLRKGSLRVAITMGILMILRLLATDSPLKDLLTSLHAGVYSNFSDFINNSFSSNTAPFLISITIGTSDTKLSNSIYENFKQFNLLHVVSISGANFGLIKNIFEELNKYCDKKLINILILAIQSYYILLIGFTNLPALRAYVFSLISIYSSISGRPISFINKLLLAVIIIINLNLESLNSKGFLLGIGFSILYKSLELQPFAHIFNNELKKLSLVFLISVLIFGSENPDFIANTIFSLIYPIIFIATFSGYFINLLGLQVEMFINLIGLLIKIIFTSLNQLSSTTNTYLQAGIYIAILINIVKTLPKYKNHVYNKFSQ